MTPVGWVLIGLGPAYVLWSLLLRKMHRNLDRVLAQQAVIESQHDLIVTQLDAVIAAQENTRLRLIAEGEKRDDPT